MSAAHHQIIIDCAGRLARATRAQKAGDLSVDAETIRELRFEHDLSMAGVYSITEREELGERAQRIVDADTDRS